MNLPFCRQRLHVMLSLIIIQVGFQTACHPLSVTMEADGNINSFKEREKQKRSILMEAHSCQCNEKKEDYIMLELLVLDYVKSHPPLIYLHDALNHIFVDRMAGSPFQVLIQT